jgi:hypothetical protein
MADCIDARIDANLITTLKTITVANGYNTAIGTVERLRSELSINGRYPYTLVIQLENDQLDEWESMQDDKLNYIIWYLDSKNDRNETANTEFTCRLRNVHADIIKALKIDVSRGGLAQNTLIPRHGFGMFIDDDICEPGVYVMVEIERLIDNNNPYLLA